MNLYITICTFVYMLRTFRSRFSHVYNNWTIFLIIFGTNDAFVDGMLDTHQLLMWLREKIQKIDSLMLAFEIKNEIFGSQKMNYRWLQKFRCHILQEVVDDKKDSTIYVEAACSNVRCVADWIKHIFKDLPLPRVSLSLWNISPCLLSIAYSKNQSSLIDWYT